MNLSLVGYYADIEEFIEKETVYLNVHGIVPVKEAAAHFDPAHMDRLFEDDVHEIISKRTVTKQGKNLNNFLLTKIQNYFK